MAKFQVTLRQPSKKGRGPITSLVPNLYSWCWPSISCILVTPVNGGTWLLLGQSTLFQGDYLNLKQGVWCKVGPYISITIPFIGVITPVTHL